MIVPNLASRPRLNTRPVWLVTAFAGFVTLVLTGINAQLYVGTNRALAEQIAQRDELQEQRNELASELGQHLSVLERVPWKGLGGRVLAVNEVLSEQQFSWTLLLEHLGAVLPWQVRVVSVSPSPDAGIVNLTLNAVSQDRDGFLDLLDRMVEDPRFIDPIPNRESWPEGGTAVGYVFTMRVGYDPKGVSE